MTTKKTLEKAYFHINNGGLSLSVIENMDVRKDPLHEPTLPQGSCEHHNEVPNTCKCPYNCYCRGYEHRITFGSKGCSTCAEIPYEKRPKENRYNRRWVFRLGTSHFGVSTKYEFPLVPLTVRWIQEALGRVLTRMETPTGQPTDGFEVEFGWAAKGTATVTARDGQQVQECWPFTPEPHVDGGSEENDSGSVLSKQVKDRLEKMPRIV